MKVFDWDKAATILLERGAQEAGAGLREDWFWTGSTILENGIPYAGGRPYLASDWATPVLEVGDAMIPCWLDQADVPATWGHPHAQIYWPESALAILFVNGQPAPKQLAAPESDY